MDLFATKGIEYLLIMGYLLLLVPFWFVVRRTAPGWLPATAAAAPGRSAERIGGWFAMPEDLHFHRGHTWARPEDAGVFRVGMDDFAQRLIGRPDALLLPTAGTRLELGEPGWSVRVNGHTLRLLSPVAGEIVEVNDEAVRAPETVCEDPYGRGWLMKVRVGRRAAALRNLLSGRLARAWMEETLEGLDTLMGHDLGVVLPDGGLPVSGFARGLGGERWPEIAAHLLLTAPD